MKPAESRHEDINEKLNALKENDVRVTFTDIWRDYWHYRAAYYHKTNEKIKKDLFTTEDSDANGEVPVDVDKFSMRKHLSWMVKYKESHNIYTTSYMVMILLLYTGVTALGWMNQ